MSFKFKGGGQVSDSVGLLVSILLRYPEVGTINVDQDEQLVQFSFFLLRDIDDPENSRDSLLESLILFNQLEGRSVRICDLNFSREEGLVTLQVKRDIESVTQNEINLLIELLRVQFSDSLSTDQGEEIPEEELLMQEEIIKHMLENLKDHRLDKSVIALREEGRVLVFNK